MIISLHYYGCSVSHQHPFVWLVLSAVCNNMRCTVRAATVTEGITRPRCLRCGERRKEHTHTRKYPRSQSVRSTACCAGFCTWRKQAIIDYTNTQAHVLAHLSTQRFRDADLPYSNLIRIIIIICETSTSSSFDWCRAVGTPFECALYRTKSVDYSIDHSALQTKPTKLFCYKNRSFVRQI